jgi:DNA-binding HxlR family transcriptional regulator
MAKADIRDIILQRYVLDILRELKSPKRYGGLQKKIRTRRTLSSKIAKLRGHGLIEVTPILVGNRYVSSYALTEKGKKIIRLLEEMY